MVEVNGMLPFHIARSTFGNLLSTIFFLYDNHFSTPQIGFADWNFAKYAIFNLDFKLSFNFCTKVWRGR